MIPHRWDVTPAEARALQETLRGAVRAESLDVAGVRLVAGCDLSADRGRPELYVGIVVVRLPELVTVDESTLVRDAGFPYVPGLLSFRELPPLLEAFERLGVSPDALLLDGHGLAHPRRCGLACHAGLWLDRPTVGCAKSVFVGRHAPVGDEPGAGADLVDEGEVIARALRTRRGARPVYVSVGHRCRLADAVDLVRRCGAGYRLPEPTRRAHLLVNALRRAHRAGPCAWAAIAET